ncbi:regulatory protein RecX [Actinokineospora spheciospongiae]|uniref:regulatory protein RecX n=1 Tax=Actinokineospora spheciospongiae TaxID=909613 RepID=UPI000D718738|nr:regulatory protein RecX [Actinokineospora spheciospongiae]PWW58441.1 regulatory protein [Actinokineospora spheciospongiae]
MTERRYARRTGGSGTDSTSRAPGAREHPRAADEQDPATRARDICYRLLALRDHTRLELEQALLRREIPEDVAQVVLGKFDKAGLINDEAFAESWVEARHRHRGLGRRAIAQELRRKGVDDTTAAEALAAVDAEAEESRAHDLVRRKLGGTRGQDPQVRLRRLVAMLARRGYAEGLAFRVVRSELENEGIDADADTPGWSADLD